MTQLIKLCVREEKAYTFLLALNVTPPLRSFLGYTLIELPTETIQEYMELQGNYRAMQDTINHLYDELCQQEVPEWDEW